MKNEIVHFEIPAKNAAKLSKFYSAVFGWTFKGSKMPGMTYWMIKTNSKPTPNFLSSGGMYDRTSAKDGPVNYVGTTNIDNTIRKFKSAGGKITQPKVEIHGMGWSAKGTDPEGNLVGIFQANMKTPGSSRSKRKR